MMRSSEPDNREESDDAGWAQWEQTFREARPVLPVVALQRIEAQMRQSIEERSTATPSRARRRWIRWTLILIALLGIGWWMLPGIAGLWHGRDPHTPVNRVQETIILPTSKEWLAAPTRAIVPAGAHPFDVIAAAAGGEPDPLPARVETVAAEQPDSERLTALFALRWRHGQPKPASDPVAGLLARPNDPQAVPLLRLLCWRALGEPAAHDDLEMQVHALHLVRDSSPWLSIFDLVAADRDDSPTQFSLALAGLRAPTDADPLSASDSAQLRLLSDAGLSRAAAGMDLLSHPAATPWLALRELDAHLTARADSAKPHSPSEAMRLLAARDLLRASYVKVTSDDLLAHCGALVIAGDAHQADDILQQARRIKYLSEPQDLAILLARLGEFAAWEQIIRPMLDHPLDYVGHPPDAAMLQQPPAPAVMISSDAKHSEEGVAVYEPAVQIIAGALHITCDRARLFRDPDGSASLLQLSGQMQVTGLNHLKSAAADSADIDFTKWTLHLSGNVVITRTDGAAHPSGEKSFSFAGD